MSNITVGVLAHVDAGKTTLSEALLFKTGRIRKAGRVDHGDAYLDTDRLEKDRGITIFSKQAEFMLGEKHIFLQDTPGHVDFSSEMERTLSVLDYAILVISGPDGIQAHTETLINLLAKHRIPTVVWVNKMDICSRSRTDIIAELQKSFSGICADFSGEIPYESIALCSENSLNEYLETGSMSHEMLMHFIVSRAVVPCFFGSALKMDGVEALISFMSSYFSEPAYPDEFGARVFKITRDGSDRLSWLKITGGKLSVKDIIRKGDSEEKINQIRIYSGTKAENVQSIEAGSVCAVTGLSESYAGEGLGFEEDRCESLLEPVLTYRIVLPQGMDVNQALVKLQPLAEEDPLLRICYNASLGEIQAQLMGRVQTEVLKQLISDRFDMDVSIEDGHILYKETIEGPVEGVGHFEPLRHYAETHLLMEPLAPGSGIVLETACSEDDLDRNWQRLILYNLAEKKHVGVLTGSPLTDVKITLIAGRAHLKHTEGGDFRQASLRAVRQGLMSAKNVLLEPYYAFKLTVPADQIGRAVSDIKAMGAEFDVGETSDGTMQILGKAPVSEMQNYQTELLSYTKGKGKLSCRPCGYYPCHNTKEVVEGCGYDPDRDIENPADSVFCSHGSGVNVKWDKVRNFMHIDSGLSIDGDIVTETSPKLKSGNLDFDEKELDAIIQREFGEIKHPDYSVVSYGERPSKKASVEIKKSYFIVDGYNMVFGWERLKKLAASDIAAAREKLAEALINYRSIRDVEIVLVFDGYKLKDNPGSKDEQAGVKIVYTKEGETADLYIEKFIHEIGHNYSVSVVSSDGLIQLAALRLGVKRMSARELEYEVNIAEAEISDIVSENNDYRNIFENTAKIK